MEFIRVPISRLPEMADRINSQLEQARKMEYVCVADVRIPCARCYRKHARSDLPSQINHGRERLFQLRRPKRLQGCPKCGSRHLAKLRHRNVVAIHIALNFVVSPTPIAWRL